MDIRKTLFEIYWKIRGVIVPTLRYSQDLYEEVIRSHVNPAVIWLDLGCGHQLLPRWRSTEEKRLAGNCRTIVGLDYDLESLRKHETILCRVRGYASLLPFKTNSFDLITANMVVEHLDNPEIQFTEIFRILRPGGVFIFHTPNIFGYTTILARLVPETLKSRLVSAFDGRKEEDVFPTYYRANSESKIRNLARSTGFDVRKISMIVSDAAFVILPPILILELLWIRIIMTKPLKRFRTNIIAVLRKAPTSLSIDSRGVS